MKKIVSIFILFIPFFSTLAQGVTFTPPTAATSFQEVFNNILAWLFGLSLALAPLMIIIGAFVMVTSAGDPKRAANGKKIILYTIIGFSIILLARGISALVYRILTGG